MENKKTGKKKKTIKQAQAGKIRGKKTAEKISHFLCGKCYKWWSVSDAPENKKDWTCPWCGARQNFLDIK